MIFVLWRLGCLSTRLADCFSRSNVFSGACTAPESGKLYFDSEKCLPVAVHAAVGQKMSVTEIGTQRADSVNEYDSVC